VAFLASYFDESYKGKSDLVIAGFVSSIDRWATFASRWKRVLDENKLPYFRFSEFKSPRSIKHLSMPARQRILDSLIDITLECASLAVSRRISPREYESLTTPKFRSAFGSAYTTAVQGCIQGVAFHLAEQDSDYEELSVFLEDGHPNAVQAIESLLGFKRKFAPVDMTTLNADHVIDTGGRDAPLVRLGTIAVGGKTKMLPLQAADMLAHSVFNPSGDLTRIVLERVRERLPFHEGNWTSEVIQQTIENISILEQHRIRGRKQPHEMSRLLGNVGIKMSVRDDGVVLMDTRQQKEITREEFRKMMSRYPGSEVIMELKQPDEDA